MAEILLCNRALSPQDLRTQCGIDIDQLASFSCAKPTMLAANTPYFMSAGQSPADRSILSQLSPTPVAEELTKLSLSYGEDNLLALAEMTAKLKDYNIGLMGASTSVYASRVGGFAGAVKDYQAALMAYRQAVVSNSAMKATLKQQAHAAFQKMQSQFRHELKVVSSQVKTSRGTPLTNADRATNIANSSRNVVKLNVTSQIQANNLVKLSKQAKFLGNGLAVIDFGSRVGNIHNSYQAGGDWEREMFIESSSFALSAVAGVAAVNIGSAALGFLVLATPIGWVGLIVGGIAVAGVAAATSMGVNQVVKEDAGEVYDVIMKKVGSK
ncbi:hypothetical protein QWY82_18885 [Simiduia curdlanivorans]|uniref:Channel forming colicins domain-containing protein n=1 Tax=Simiduia curdlanivorans TaxID=1492769 RepID=A0ABV8V420_9GAMM|nr:hypothetical protein [Simiduia curdlanivorans]MDN3640873.1 hypothetical protein [Simiduia curdlanivorans]